MSLSTLEMSRRLFLSNELTTLLYNKDLENKEVVVQYITQELKQLEIKGQTY
jgi:hypothetical protein